VIQETTKPYFYLRTAQGFKEKELIRHFVEGMPFGMFNFNDDDGNLILVSAHALSTARRRVDETQSQHFDFNNTHICLMRNSCDSWTSLERLTMKET